MVTRGGESEDSARKAAESRADDRRAETGRLESDGDGAAGFALEEWASEPTSTTGTVEPRFPVPNRQSALSFPVLHLSSAVPCVPFPVTRLAGAARGGSVLGAAGAGSVLGGAADGKTSGFGPTEGHFRQIHSRTSARSLPAGSSRTRNVDDSSVVVFSPSFSSNPRTSSSSRESAQTTIRLRSTSGSTWSFSLRRFVIVDSIVSATYSASSRFKGMT